MAQKRKKRRRINIRNVMILVIGLTVIIAGCLYIPVYLDKKEQAHRQDLLEQVLARRSSWENEISSLKLNSEDEEEQENFKAIQTEALKTDQDVYEQLKTLIGQRISDEEKQTIESLDPEEAGAKWKMILEKADSIDPYWLRFLAKDDDRLDFTAEYFNQDQYQNPPAQLDVSLNTVPALLQWDQKWGYVPYGDMNIAFAGCAPTALSMVLSYLKQDPSITPPAVARFAEEDGDYVEGAGTAYTIFENAAAHYGVDVTGVPVDMDSIQTALDNGQILIAHAVPGKFTTIGHFMVITGTEDGKLIVHDPNSIKNTNTSWDPDEMLPEFDMIWGFSKKT